MLKELVENNYETIEERRFNKQYLATWAGIFIAFLVGLSSLWISYSNSQNQSEDFSEFSKSLNSTLDSLESSVNKTNQELKSIYNQVSIQNDSLILEK